MIEKVYQFTFLKLFISVKTNKKTLFQVTLLIKYMGLKGIQMS